MAGPRQLSRGADRPGVLARHGLLAALRRRHDAVRGPARAAAGPGAAAADRRARLSDRLPAVANDDLAGAAGRDVALAAERVRRHRAAISGAVRSLPEP